MDYIVDLTDILELDEIEYFAHRKETEQQVEVKELLLDHTQKTNEYFSEIIKDKKINRVFERIFERLKLPNKTKKLFFEMIYNVPNFHDIGKINPTFQREKMDNILDKEVIAGVVEANHSMLSAAIYIFYFSKEINEHYDAFEDLEDEQFIEKIKLYEILLLLAFVISKHHGDIYDFKLFLSNSSYKKIIIALNRVGYLKVNLSKDDIEELDDFNTYRSEGFEEMDDNTTFSFASFTLAKLMHSLLIAADYYATTGYMNGYQEVEFGGLNHIDRMKDVYEKSELLQQIRSSNDVEGINKYRTELFLTAEKHLEELKDTANIFFLEAPTGSGKSNTAMNLSFKLLDEEMRRKIFYVYPFNTLVEQNMETITKFFKGTPEIMNDVAVVNSITPLPKGDQNKKTEDLNDYVEMLLDRQFFNYPFVVTTHVSLFDILFGYKKSSNMPFYQLVGSVIVLDEIQTYNSQIWPEIIRMLNEYAELLDMKVIIMSATLPDLGQLLDEETKNKVVPLLTTEEREGLFQNPIFKDRVMPCYELLDQNELSLDNLFDHMQQHGERKVFIEFITKKAAKEFYHMAKERYEFGDYDGIERKVELMTGEDNLARKKQVIKTINQDSDPLLFVATQVVEAGVDIDMDIGYKDCSSVINEEQFMGRINRSCKKEGCKAYFFNYANEKNIYRENLMVNNNMGIQNKDKHQKYRRILEEKDFMTYFEDLLQHLERKNIKEFLQAIENKNYASFSELLTLITPNDRYITYFFNTEVKKDNDNVLQGQDVWNRYKTLLLKKVDRSEYAKQQVELQACKADMSYFIYQIPKEYSNLPYDDIIGDIIYIEDAKKYFDEDGVLQIDKDSPDFI